MWGCNCKNQLSNGTFRIRYHVTEVTDDKVCKLCGYYAIWFTGQENLRTKGNIPITVVNKKTKKITHLSSTKEASNLTKIPLVNILSSPTYKRGEFYIPKKYGYAIIKGHIKSLSKDILDRLTETIIYVYKEETLLKKAHTVREVRDYTGDSITAIHNNIAKKTKTTKNGFVYVRE